ncbi:FadR/GntR family transcriptional regulator [Paraburkholderia caffeinilytica]|uniref:FadR/GntR family transcriptional regulator n=1 Tax=Paraburkholderia caffeinilytica TaxID=1761016 RepID=UPI0038BCF990
MSTDTDTTSSPIDNSIQRTTLSERVAAKLGQLIVDGVHAPGTSLPTEPMLEKQFGVSRITIRDAVKLLANCGLVKVRHGSGMTVQPAENWQYLDPLVLFAHVNSPRSQKMLSEILEVQHFAEAELAALAAKRRTEPSLAKMTELVEQMKMSLDDHARYTALDLEFHEAIARAASNDLLRNMLAPIHRVVRDGYMLTTELLGAPERSLEGHVKILRAIERRNPKAAREAMGEHLDLFREHIDMRFGETGGAQPRQKAPTFS